MMDSPQLSSTANGRMGHLHEERNPEKELCVRTGLQAGRPLGDVVADCVHVLGLDRLTEFYTAMTGEECGCDERREALNRLCPNTPL